MNTESGDITMSTKRTSLVWNHYKLSDCKKKATCLHCAQQYAYTSTAMSNLSRHVKRKHPEINYEDKVIYDNASLQVFTLNEVGQEGDSSLKSYEITMKGFEELEQESDDTLKDQSDPGWTPGDADEGLKLESSESGPSKPKKSKAKRSALWNHFEKSPCGTFGRCVHCSNSIKLGTISNLSRHLRLKHPTLANVRVNYSAQVSAESNFLKPSNNIYDEHNFLRNDIEISSDVANVNISDLQNQIDFESKTVETDNIVTFALPFDQVNETNTTQACQTEFLVDEDFDMCEYLKPKKTLVVAEQVDFQLVKMIVKGCHPISIVEQSAFKDFVTLLNPKYQLPSSTRISQELVPELYKECEKRASKSLQSAEGICLYIDLWVSKNTRYMCITAHFINSECKFESLFLSCHILSTTENIAEISERLLQTVCDWEIEEKIVAVTTDNTQAISDAVKLCHWTHIPHFIKILARVLHECLQAVRSLVSKVRLNIEYLTTNCELMAKVCSTQKLLKLPQVKLIAKVNSDWSSSFITLDMLTRYLKLKAAICHLKPDLPGAKPSDAEWKVLKSTVDVLSVFKTIKQEVVVEGRATLAKVAFYTRTIKREMTKFQSDITNPSEAVYLAAIAEKTMDEHFKVIEETDLVQNSVLLDPRLKKHVFVDESASAAACSKLKKEVCEITLPDTEYGEPNPDSVWYSFDSEVKKLNEVKDPIGKGILELDNYLQEQLLRRDDNPLLWWNQRQSIYPRLYKLARKYLCVTTKPAIRESISYKCAYMLSNLKNSGSTNIESEVMFLYHNM